MACCSFTELDKAVVHVIRLASFLRLWFNCVCLLMPSHNTYRLTWVSLTLDVGYLFTSKAQPLLLTLDEGCLLMATPPDLECGVAPLGLPALIQPPLLGCGVAPLQVRKQQLELDMEQQIGSKYEKEYIKAVYCHPA